MNPPRALYLDFPLGRTAGRAEDVEMQRDIMRAALERLATASQAGEIVDLPYRWAADDDWKDRVMRPAPKGEENTNARAHADDRIERFPTPQYQMESDRPADEADCDTCVFLTADR